jgi:hypothetical protein
MDNDTVGTDKFTLKIDYMESSGNYNRGFANMVATTYSKHPIEDYKSAFNDSTGNYVDKASDYRTSVKGYPVLMFHQPDNLDTPIYIGRYNMLTDKGSDEIYGFKPDKSVTQKYVDDAPVRNIAECWEFENNSRGFCSFRDPWNRKELSFAAPASDPTYTAAGAPIVADSFEYRYNCNDDILDLLYSLDSASEENQATLLESFTDNKVGATIIKETDPEDSTKKIVKEILNSKGETVDLVNNKESSRQLMLDLYSNWEKAVAWVWSTCTDSAITDDQGVSRTIPSIGDYKEVTGLAQALYKANDKYYIQKEDGNYALASGDFDADENYFVIESGEYVQILLTDDESKVYKVNTYYVKENDIYQLSSDEDYNEATQYYELIEDESSIDSYWDLPEPVTLGGKTYKKDTKEYRQAKFKNELSKHFDIEYLATYFLMTEIFECYDSRGKNAMFATWGPKEQGGDYIWYPIFYDIDTQLGINNTGIPSFEYYIDATEDGSFSTNDSVLWNNFYYYFKGLIIDKYNQLMGD